MNIEGLLLLASFAGVALFLLLLSGKQHGGPIGSNSLLWIGGSAVLLFAGAFAITAAKNFESFLIWLVICFALPVAVIFIMSKMSGGPEISRSKSRKRSIDSADKLFGGKSLSQKLKDDEVFAEYREQLDDVDYYSDDDPWMEATALKSLLSDRVDELREEKKLSASERKRGKKLVAKLPPFPSS